MFNEFYRGCPIPNIKELSGLAGHVRAMASYFPGILVFSREPRSETNACRHRCHPNPQDQHKLFSGVMNPDDNQQDHKQDQVIFWMASSRADSSSFAFSKGYISKQNFI